jgi:fatty-acid desaturase
LLNILATDYGRNYETDENSCNNWVFASATSGDGWRNNHHADPRSAAYGFDRWWELDVTLSDASLFPGCGLGVGRGSAQGPEDGERRARRAKR